MKNKHFIGQVVTVFTFLLLLSSCGKDYLEVDHYDIVYPEAMFESEDGINKSLIGCYDALYGIKGKGDVDWHFKPHIQTANMPALDCQAGGWDANFSTYSWKADDLFFLSLWSQNYTAIDRVNRFLGSLAKTDASVFEGGQEIKDQIEAEARAIRAYNYFFLAVNFGRLPMLETGENYTNTTAKPRTETVKETYDKIIEDLLFTISKVDWRPRDNQGGRITLGMAKAYIAKAYMQIGDYTSAQKHLQDIVDSKKFELEPVYGAIHSESYRWGKESVWEIAYPDLEEMSWGAEKTYDALWRPIMNVAKWGSLYISHEWVKSFEPGDRRLEYSVVTYGNENPYSGDKLKDIEYERGGTVPNNLCLKYWKREAGKGDIYYSMSAILMRYSEVLLNLAECKFQTGASGWSEIDQIRDRAWGNLEIGVTTDDLPVEYPDSIARQTLVKTVPAAETFYASYAAAKGYTSPSWKVALLMERRHEFVAEYSLWYDITRMGMAKEFLNAEYPIGASETNRSVEYNDNYALFPIPYDEILTNDGISQQDQNPGY